MTRDEIAAAVAESSPSCVVHDFLVDRMEALVARAEAAMNQRCAEAAFFLASKHASPIETLHAIQALP